MHAAKGILRPNFHRMQDGITYEREAIAAWLARSDTSPMTNEALPSKRLQPNLLVKQMILALMGFDGRQP